MSRFYTEKETEAFLQDETRILSLPDGRKESVTAMHLIWSSFDHMEATKAFSRKELIQCAYDWYKRDKRFDFTTYFRNFIAFAYSERKAYCDDFTDRQIRYRENVLASLQDRARDDFNRASGKPDAFHPWLA